MKTLVLILSRNSEKALAFGLAHFPEALKNSNQIEFFLLDDNSKDKSVETVSDSLLKNGFKNFQFRKNKMRYGYGALQKIGLWYAKKNSFEGLIVLQGSGIRELGRVSTFIEELEKQATADAILFKGRPSLFGWWGGLFGIFLNRLSKTSMCGWFSNVRAYRVRAFADIPFELNTSESHFDVEVLLQMIGRKKTILEIKDRSASSRWLDRKRRGHYLDSLKAGLKYRLQRYNLFFDVRFHPEFLTDKERDHHLEPVYGDKFDVWSPHSAVCIDSALVPSNSVVFDIGCSTGYISQFLVEKKNCRVTGVDLLPPSQVDSAKFDYRQINLESGQENVAAILEKGKFDVVLLLDVLEHLSSPERFLLSLYRKSSGQSPRFLVSTGNVAFIVIRLMLLFGFFNYGEKGILDITHKRLFSHRTFRNLLEQTGFVITNKIFFPVPFQKLGVPKGMAKLFELANRMLIKISPSIFSYQIMFEAVLPPSLDQLLKQE